MMATEAIKRHSYRSYGSVAYIVLDLIKRDIV